ncbi:MAG: hypothetical protein LUE90_10255 [Clostridiales bacterium]|nr:hypothetical protein [Clostridiales bacterium]
MNDWNRNGKYDAADSYMDYKLSGAGKHTTRKSGKSGGTGCGVLIYMFFMIIMLAACPGIGLLMVGGLIWFWMCGGV